MNYKLEATARKLNGVVTIGAREGYSGSKEYSLAEVLDNLDTVNREFNGKTLNCMVSESNLVGRTSEESYREKLYHLDFVWSPRAGEIKPEIFVEQVVQYGSSLAEKMKQERFYLDFEGNTSVYKLMKGGNK